jgi:hypothetical protein
VAAGVYLGVGVATGLIGEDRAGIAIGGKF